jgi:VWFA-related protein
LIAVTLICCVAPIRAQKPPDEGSQAKLRVRTNLVMVPVFVTTKSGEVVFSLTADDFVLTDNGTLQKVTVEQDTDGDPLALAIVVETGGAGTQHLDDYQGLNAMIDALIGSVEHRVAVIGFDSTPHLLVPFTANTDEASHQLSNLSEGDQGAAILDAVAFAVEQLRTQPPQFRRAILLLSETIDQGSKINLTDAVRLASDTNTTIYSYAFSSTHAAVAHEASKLSGGAPGPAHGCFSREGADPEYDGHYSKQVLDCISQLAPPLRLATMAFLAARSSLRKNTAESFAQLNGGEFHRFHNAKDLKAGLIAASNDVPNYYVLSFSPTSAAPGLHALHVTTKSGTHLIARSRREYWIDEDAAAHP